MRRVTFSSLLAAALVAQLGLGIGAAVAAGGSLDTAYGNAGVALVALPDADSQGFDLAALPDGSTVVVGDDATSPIVVKLSPTGQLDSTFGSNGVVRLPFAGFGIDVLLDSAGRVVVAGVNLTAEPSRPFVARLSAAGVLDATFGTGGVTSLDVGFNDEIYNVRLSAQPAGPIMVGVGLVRSAGDTNPDVLVAQLTDTGSLATSFGGDGIVGESFADGHGVSTTADFGDLAATSDGGVVLAGSNEQQYAVAVRLTSAGVRSTNFGLAGAVTVEELRHATTVRALSDGSLVVATDGWLINRFSADGQTDVYATRLDLECDAAYPIELLEDSTGGLVVANNGEDCVVLPPGLVRLDAAGVEDSSYVSPPAERRDVGVVYGAARLATGQVVTAGYRPNDVGYDLTVARFRAVAAPTPTIGNVPPVLVAGQPVALRGTAAAGAIVELFLDDPTKPDFVPVKNVRADTSGNWSTSITPVYLSQVKVRSGGVFSAVRSLEVQVKVNISEVRSLGRSSDGRCITQFLGGTYPYVLGSNLFVRTDGGAPVGFQKLQQFGSSGRISPSFRLPCNRSFVLRAVASGKASNGVVLVRDGASGLIRITTRPTSGTLFKA